MKNLKKVLALLCALTMTALVTACGSEDDSSDSSSSSLPSASDLLGSSEESSEEESSEEDEESSEEESSEEEDDEESVSSDSVTLNQEETCGDISYLVSDEWTQSTYTDNGLLYTTSNSMGMLMVYSLSVDDLGIEIPEGTDTSTILEDQFTDVAESFRSGVESSGSITVVDEEYNTINGKDAYGINFTMDESETGGISNDNYAFCFVVDDTLYAIGCYEYEGDTEVLDVLGDILDSITF